MESQASASINSDVLTPEVIDQVSRGSYSFVDGVYYIALSLVTEALQRHCSNWHEPINGLKCSKEKELCIIHENQMPKWLRNTIILGH